MAVLTPIVGVFEVWYALVLLLQSPARDTSPAYDTAKAVAPLDAWAVVLLVLGLVLLVVPVVHRRAPDFLLVKVRRAAAVSAAGWVAFYGAAFAASAHDNATVTWTVAPLYALVFVVHALITGKG